MTRKRNYILKNDSAPEEDLWVELDDASLAVPMMKIYCEGEQGKQHLISLTTAMANRLISILSEMVESSNKPIDGYVTEREDD